MNRPPVTYGLPMLVLLVYAAAVFGTHPAFADDRDADKLARGARGRLGFS